MEAGWRRAGLPLHGVEADELARSTAVSTDQDAWIRDGLTRFSYTACYTVPEHLCAIKDPVRRVVVLVTEFSAYTV